MNPTVLDLIVVGAVLLSTMLAFIRGFTREAFSLLAWIGAAAAAWLLLPLTETYARQIVDDVLAARIIAAVAVFVLALLAVTLVASPVANRVRDSRFRPLDRALGGLYGVARGAVLVVLGYVALISFYPQDEQIPWMRGAITKPYLDAGKSAAETLLPAGMIQSSRKAAQDMRRGAEIKKNIDGDQQPAGDKSGGG